MGYCHICGCYSGDLETIGIKKIKICGICLKLLRNPEFPITKLYPEEIPKQPIERYKRINQLMYEFIER